MELEFVEPRQMNEWNEWNRWMEEEEKTLGIILETNVRNCEYNNNSLPLQRWPSCFVNDETRF